MRFPRGEGPTGLTSEYQSDRCSGCGKKKTLIEHLRSGHSYYLGADRNPQAPEAQDSRVVGGTAEVCTNRECSLFTDLSRVPTWRTVRS